MASDEPEQRILVQQNIDLRRKLEEEHQSYKRKLANYQEGQQKQAQLVQKLQQKVNKSLRSFIDHLAFFRFYNIKNVVPN